MTTDEYFANMHPADVRAEAENIDLAGRHSMGIDTLRAAMSAAVSWQPPKPALRCTWFIEDYNEDGPIVRDCGRPVEPTNYRPLCPWHESAMAIPDDEFERRVGAGETWSR